MKPRKREHVATGSRVVRGSVRAEYPADFGAPDPQPFFPACSLLPAIVVRRQAEVPVCPRGDGAKGLETLRGLSRRRDRRDPNKVGAHVSRRRFPTAMQLAGGSFARLLKVGQGHSPAYRVYLDLGREEARAMACILIEASEDVAPEKNAPLRASSSETRRAGTQHRTATV